MQPSNPSKTTSPTPNSVSKGRQAEEKAVEFLQKQGYRILDRNAYNDHCEVDIVAEDLSCGFLVFVEVKSAKNAYFGPPELQVSPKKMRHLYRAAEIWLWKRRMHHRACRFDVVSLQGEAQKATIKHIKNAFVMGI